MKKNMKKTIILSGILCLLLLCGCGGEDNPKETPANTPAPSTELTAETLKDYPESPVSDFEFEEDYETGDISLRGYNGNDEIVVVPSTYEGKPVKYIGTFSLANDCPAKAIKFPDSVIEIEECSVGNNEKLEVVVLGTKTEKIGGSAFLNCANLRDVELNEGLVSIEMNAFGICPSLKTLYVPSSVTDTTAGKLGTNNECTIYGEKGSFIEKEIKENGAEYMLSFEER